jgi:hypothetical protein
MPYKMILLIEGNPDDEVLTLTANPLKISAPVPTLAVKLWQRLNLPPRSALI